MFLLDLFLPKRCLGCGQEGYYFCPQCQKEIKPLNFQTFPVISFFPYRGLVKKAIINLKYRFVTDLVEELTDLIIKTISQEKEFCWLKKLSKRKEITLIPLPLHYRRFNWRGFNQSELLGKRLADYFGWQLRTDVLIRQKSTKPQVGLKNDKRQENVQGAFKINHNSQYLIRDSQVFLFDDVWTTGSTLKEAAKVLKKAGFKKVYGLTICR
ncbi:hypothetical protein COY29_03045 [Candidatus Woesebacteria bacterium CG_4_10_14_0_2_um_filter_39_14]|uniref:Phosphoribosyltransferase domain-containing protein n=3 Tax=Microgenomates group TaxID=1794810 RepID=A0A2M6YPN3_9BACT|nr:MAG: hypothetical protein COT04_01900 [Candidatus Shapirobacteria bacterium CG07_land_8_20_14_0_80_39_12]PIZ48771.1 MAG: hypothetical protein COY29_03045 [Candidatus Woesebacteria bacterium CG_4_10_14_0_2_um_filter_39_14]PJA49208.1 MAG: hypothetical protein CO169_02610 [Candidatus Shapirobacteria bacterium CG_4_9_14_3_um_filter_39_13]